jgi:type I restriction enzyme R subunit
MGYQSEAQLEKLLVEQLIKQEYKEIKIANEEDLVNNFRVQLNKHNEKKLQGTSFTDKEFERILRYVEGKSVFQSSKILRDKFVLEKEDGSEVYIEFFDTKHWCKNLFQVTTQTTVIGKYKNRYDVTLLINGLPLIQIELKRRGLIKLNVIENILIKVSIGTFRFLSLAMGSTRNTLLIRIENLCLAILSSGLM